VIYGSIAARLAGVPKIVNTITGLGSVFTEEKKDWLRTVVEQMYRVSMPCAHYNFFQNEEDFAFFMERRFVEPGKSGLLPGSGVDCAYFKPVSESTGEEKAAPTFLMVARLLRHKGVYDFVEAASLTKRRFPDARFELLGGRDERNPTVVPQVDVDRWQSQGVVRWLGEVPDVRPIIGKADVVVLPSYYAEGTPRSLLEAAAMGKPIITTHHKGCRDVVDEGVTGLLVDVKNPRALANAMIEMVEKPGMRAKMGEAGRRKVEREFDERTVIEKITNIYDSYDFQGSSPF
jgi:glycosyltransferase involved in cell wall biosynthesis